MTEAVARAPWARDPQTQPRRLSAFEIIDPLKWEGLPTPRREWMVQDVIARRTVAMLSGDGGLGKSLLVQQLLTATALGKPFLGLGTAACRTFGVFCEDDPEELWRRQDDVNRHYDIGFGDLEDVHLMSRVGLDNGLMEFDRRTDKGKPTPFYHQIAEHCRNFGAQLLVLDTVADTFTGNENIRPQVRQFVNLLRGLAHDIQGAVILCAHPSVAGLQSGSGISGSTAWNNSVRSRLYLTRPKQDDDGTPSDDRVLKTLKSNYGKVGGSIRLRWIDGVFARTDQDARTGVFASIRASQAERAFIACLDICGAQGRALSESANAGNYAPKVMAQMPEGKEFERDELTRAMERLFAKRAIRIGEMGTTADRHKRRAIVREETERTDE